MSGSVSMIDGHIDEVLKPCPFCGGKPKRMTRTFNTLGAYGGKETERTWFAVVCSGCKTAQPYRHYFAKASAETAWNRRADT